MVAGGLFLATAGRLFLHILPRYDSSGDLQRRLRRLCIDVRHNA